jgi:hypothetical protein
VRTVLWKPRRAGTSIVAGAELTALTPPGHFGGGSLSWVAGVRVAVPASQNPGPALRVEGMDGRGFVRWTR